MRIESALGLLRESAYVVLLHTAATSAISASSKDFFIVVFV